MVSLSDVNMLGCKSILILNYGHFFLCGNITRMRVVANIHARGGEGGQCQ